MVSDLLGDALPGTSHGFFASDTRFLSTYVLSLDGRRPVLLTARNTGHDTASFYATNTAQEGLDQGAVGLVRDRQIDGALHDRLALANHSGRTLDLALRIDFGADFLDIFEVRSPASLQDSAPAEPEGACLEFSVRQDGLLQRTSVSFSTKPRVEGAAALFELHLLPQQEWRLDIEVRPSLLEQVSPPRAAESRDRAPLRARRHAGESYASWTAPLLQSDDVDLLQTYRRSVADLRALELTTPDGHRLPAAGLPWFMAVFGRDSLLTAYQTLLLGPELAVGALHALAAYQANEYDAFRDAEPGKMPHEVRNGRLARSGRLPHACYYGTVDATPLWLIVLSETYRWTGDLDMVRELLPAAEAALNWIDGYGDLDGDGFVEYRRRSPDGLENQGWKDSWDAIRFADGRLAEGPIALAEVQGYVFDAKRRMAELFDALGRHDRALALREQATRLQDAFDAAFWMPEHGYYALALDGSKRRVDSITSNPAHGLWTGIVPDRRAADMAERLLADDMFSGWGLRTMSSRMAGYGPVSYHCGSVWPHDTVLVAQGLARYGFGEHAARLIGGVLDAAAEFASHRLPELFAGYPRREGGFPVEYPAANAPQAWAAGSVILALRTLLGIEPEREQLAAHRLPGAPHCTLAGIPFRGRRLTLPDAEPADRAL